MTLQLLEKFSRRVCMQGPADPWRASRRAEGAASVKGSDSRLGEL